MDEDVPVRINRSPSLVPIHDGNLTFLRVSIEVPPLITPDRPNEAIECEEPLSKLYDLCEYVQRL